MSSHRDNRQCTEAIDRYRSLMAQDEEIITLRQQVRKAAESKLSHGIIDAPTRNTSSSS